MNETPDKLLAADEPAPVTVHNEYGRSPFLIVADHAGNFVPRALGRLGIPEAELERHIAWDIGIAAIGRLLSDKLDATLVQQNYSRGRDATDVAKMITPMWFLNYCVARTTTPKIEALKLDLPGDFYEVFGRKVE